MASHRWTGGLSVSGALSLAAIVAVLVVVSVPHLHGLALHENEADARATAKLLARGLAAAEEPQGLRALLAHSGPGQLPDAELLEGGAVVRRHGYLFALASVRRDTSGGRAPAIVAWPWAHADTGTAAFLVDGTGASWCHDNSRARWEGLEAAPPLALDDLAGWRAEP